MIRAIFSLVVCGYRARIGGGGVRSNVRQEPRDGVSLTQFDDSASCKLTRPSSLSSSCTLICTCERARTRKPRIVSPQSFARSLRSRKRRTRIKLLFLVLFKLYIYIEDANAMFLVAIVNRHFKYFLKLNFKLQSACHSGFVYVYDIYLT